MSKRYRCPVCHEEFGENDQRCSHDSTLVFVTDAGPGSEPRPSQEPHIGTVLDGKYRIDALLGRGGMGAVYQGTHVQLDRTVAVKLMLESVLAMAGGYERFKREARAIARLKHANIVTIYDFGGGPETGAYLVMEHLEGRTLAQILRQEGAQPPEFAIAVMRQVCSAVHAAHEAGILHRDLKSENIFLEGDVKDASHVKVLDFGIAKLLDTTDRTNQNLTEEGAIIGTPGYMSPEQAAGGAADVRSDVYSLGCILYETLTGRLPFTAPTIPALLQRYLRESPTPPSVYAPAIPPDLDQIILHALGKWPEDRYQTVRELEAALAKTAPANRHKGKTLPLSPDAIPAPTEIPETVAVLPPSLMPDDDSLAVLPFEGENDDPGAEFLGEGLAERLIASLSALPRLRIVRVVSPAGGADPVDVGRGFGVRAAITGRVSIKGDRVSLAVEFYDVESAWHLWGVRYSRAVADLHELSDELLRDVVEKMRLRRASGT